MADLRQLKDKAAELAAKGKLDKAAELYRQALAGDPKDVAARQKLAEALRRAGRTEEAVETYRAVAERFARDGLLMKAIAISKTLLELDPGHVETQAALAELYARRAAVEGTRPPPRTATPAIRPAVRPGPLVPPPPAAAPEPDPEERAVAIALPRPPAIALAPGVPPVPEVALEIVVDGGAEPLSPEARGPVTAFSEIVLAAEAAAEDGVEEEILLGPEPVEAPARLDGAGEAPLVPPPAAARPPPPAVLEPGLPRFPIFSDLGRDAFVALARATVLHRVPAGEVVLREGDGGTSFYVVATGSLAVSRRDERGEAVLLGRLGEGDFFGEMALLSGAARAATVVAEEPSELLELRAEVLREIAGSHPHLAGSLRRFYRQRLLANAMAVSAVFRPFAKGDRMLVVERFRAREVRAGETIVREGEPSDGLYVVLEGALDVLKRKDGTRVAVARLAEGDVFGEMSCLGKTPASASVVVRRGGTLLRLPREEFDELIVTHPQILEAVAQLSEERAESLDAILSGHAQWTEDGLVLV